MPKFLEKKLAKEAAAKGFSGEHRDRYIYGAMNNMGAMKGNQETKKGAAMEARHEAHQQRQARSAKRAKSPGY